MMKDQEKEQIELFDKLAHETANTLQIPIDEARKRLIGLQKSGILNHEDPNDPESQMRIDAFLMIPSSTYEHLG